MARRGRIHGLPTIADLLDARNVVRRYHPRTPLYLSPTLSDCAGCEIYIKYENHSPVRSFKSRGALYGLSRLLPEEREAGVVTASTGNHGQAVAYAGGVLGIQTTIVVPPGTSSIKCEAIRSFGGDLRFFGRDLAEAAQYAQQLAADERRVYIEDGNDGGVMAGAASLAWEVVEDLPDVSVVVAPVGGGNLIAAISLVVKRINPEVRIVGVQSEAAPAVARSWEAGRIIEVPCQTSAEGLATSFPGELAFQVIKDGIDKMLLVRENDLRRNVLTALRTTGQVVEGAGAAPFAALEKIGSEWRGSKVVLILSGGNLAIEDLRTLLTEAGCPNSE